jgi:hypothetical protein
MFTSMLWLAVAGAHVHAATTAPAWKRDYAAASVAGRAARKPLAVFVGNGDDGWGQVSSTGRLGPEVRGVLRESYVCLYVDLDTSGGRRLAADLELTTEGPGLVISDHSGEVQAFRRRGTLPPEELGHWLRTFADPNRVVSRTETGAREDVRPYPPTYYAPAPAFGFAPGFGFSRGGCSS